MRVLFVRSDQAGCGHYRVSIPALALRERGHHVDILDSKPKLRACNEWFSGYDVCVLQRCSDRGWIDLIRTLPTEKRPTIVYEADDLITELPPTNPSYREYLGARRSIQECISLCDAVICSTPELASEFQYLNVRCYVVPNYIDVPGLRNWSEPEDRLAGKDRVVIGWLGGLHHVGDEAPMKEAMYAIVRKYPKVIFAFCGNRDLGKIWRSRMFIGAGQWMYLEPTDFESYPARISQFDIGVAPLVNNRFNRCKSDLRLLEYGAWGVPYVASYIAPYSRIYRSYGGGYLAANTSEWLNGLSYLIENRPRSKEIGSRFQWEVLRERGSEACGKGWEGALSLVRIVRDRPVYPNYNPERNDRCPCGSGRKYKACCIPVWGN